MNKALKFNPSFQTDDESVANFIVRRYQFETIIDAMTSSANSQMDAPRFLVPAPRGAGKTTLCRRVVAETRLAPKLREAWQAIFLGEESYTVTTPGEFFLECLFHLKDQAPSAELTKDYIRATEARSEEELLELTLGRLRDFAQTAGKRLLVIAENFHTILNEQIQDSKSEGSRSLIDALDEGTLFAVLATSVTQASSDHATPLPQHYHRIELLPLSLGECRELWESLTGIEVNEEKLRPLQILTGGSPRLLHILAEFVRSPSLHDLMTNLNYLIDQNTEYFKSQLDALPTLERKVFVTLLDMWDPKTAKQVAEAARVNTNTASAMLARLTNRGAVIKELGRGRTAIYVAAERLFSIYYLMRRHSHPSRRVRALVSFMMAYYDSEELVDTTARLTREACAIEPARREDYHSTFDAIMSHTSEAVRHQILAQTSPDFIQSFRGDQRASLDQANYLPGDPGGAKQDAAIRTLIQRIDEAAGENDLDTIYSLLMEGLELNSEIPGLWIRLSLLELQRGSFVAAIEAGEKARRLAPGDPWSHAILGQTLSLAGRTDEAESVYRTALEYEDGEFALIPLARILRKQGDCHAEALQLLRQAVAAAEGRRNCIPSRELAELLIHNGDDVQAIEVIEAALRANEHCVCCLTLYGYICRRRGEPAIAERQYRAALDVDKTEIAALTGLSQLVSAKEAAELIERAIKAAPADPRVLLARARLHSSEPDAQAEDAKAALEIDPNFIEAHLYLASLEANRANLHDAIAHLEAVLADLPSQRELIPSFVDAAMTTIELDNGVCLSGLLDRHENAVAVEPLGVAVQMLRGENPIVAKEIKDVAWDIIVRSVPQTRPSRGADL